MEGSLEAVPSGNTAFVPDPRGFLKFGAVPSLDGRFRESSGGLGGGVCAGANSAVKSLVLIV